jgi:hypothetical protein
MFMNLLLGATLARQYSNVLGSVRFLSRFAHLIMVTHRHCQR